MAVQQTFNGIPYPDGNDAIVNGDNVMQAIAEAVQLRGAQLVTGSSGSTRTWAGGASATYGHVDNVAIAAAAWPRVALVAIRALCTAYSGGTVDLVPTIAGAQQTSPFYRFQGLGSGLLVLAFTIPKNTTSGVGANLVGSSATATITATGQHTGLIGVLLPASVAA